MGQSMSKVGMFLPIYRGKKTTMIKASGSFQYTEKIWGYAGESEWHTFFSAELEKCTQCHFSAQGDVLTNEAAIITLQRFYVYFFAFSGGKSNCFTT